MKKILFLLAVTLFFEKTESKAQEFFDDSNEPVLAFRGPLLVNAQTTAMPVPGGFEFMIRHRFGYVEMNKTLVSEFLGMDGVANIRFSFMIPATKSFAIGIGRAKSGKTYDLELKKLILQQQTDNGPPVSLVLYFNMAVNTDAEAPVKNYTYFADGTTPFRHKFNHRLSYNSEIVVSRKFGERFSFQLAPVFIYRNLVDAGQENHFLVCPAGGAIRTGLNSSFIFEYAYRFNNKPLNGLYPLSIGYEFGTVSHVFQIVVTSINELNEQQAYSKETSEYNKGQIAFGFNMQRTFWNKKKKKLQ